MKYKAFLFDLNGTMIDDMNYHIHAWHSILNGLGANLTLARMKEECYGKNHELLERIFPGRFTDSEKNEMSLDKERKYQEDYRPELKLLPGLGDLLPKANNAGVKMAIGSAAIMFNIDFVLDGLGIRNYFDVLVSADNVSNSKPHPETYLKCAEQLDIEPSTCLVFEDNPKGVEAAQNAGMDAYVITSMHTIEEFSYCKNVIGHSADFTTQDLQTLNL